MSGMHSIKLKLTHDHLEVFGKRGDKSMYFETSETQKCILSLLVLQIQLINSIWLLNNWIFSKLWIGFNIYELIY